jgi:hypothetical protein
MASKPYSESSMEKYTSMKQRVETLLSEWELLEEQISVFE